MFITSFLFFLHFFCSSPPIGQRPIHQRDMRNIFLAFSHLRRVANGVIRPVTIDTHSQDLTVRPAQILRLLTRRVFQMEGYDVSAPHIAIYVRNVEAFMEFRREYELRRFPNQLLRTIFFEELTLDFPTLRRILDGLEHVQMITFDHVQFEMDSWRNREDLFFLFTPERWRMLNFLHCAFLEEVGVVLFNDTSRIMGNRIPVYFYRLLFGQGFQNFVDAETGKCFFLSNFIFL